MLVTSKKLLLRQYQTDELEVTEFILHYSFNRQIEICYSEFVRSVYFTTTLTNFFGTTMTRLTVLPSVHFLTAGKFKAVS